jgi:hypothetical protein
MQSFRIELCQTAVTAPQLLEMGAASILPILKPGQVHIWKTGRKGGMEADFGIREEK